MLFVVWVAKHCKHQVKWEKPSRNRVIASILIPMTLGFIVAVVISVTLRRGGFDTNSNLIALMVAFSFLFLVLSTIYILIGGFVSGYPPLPYSNTI
jgi:hypothetical protein